MRFELFLGLRYFRGKRKNFFVSVITFISVAGVMVGVMALVVVLAVMTGFDQTALGLQGGITMFTNPVVWSKALVPTAKSLVSAEKRQMMDAERESHPNYDRYKNYNLALMEHGRMAGVRIVAAVGPAGRDDPHRRRADGLHRPDLDRRRMGA